MAYGRCSASNGFRHPMQFAKWRERAQMCAVVSVISPLACFADNMDGSNRESRNSSDSSDSRESFRYYTSFGDSSQQWFLSRPFDPVPCNVCGVCTLYNMVMYAYCLCAIVCSTAEWKKSTAISTSWKCLPEPFTLAFRAQYGPRSLQFRLSSFVQVHCECMQRH